MNINRKSSVNRRAINIVNNDGDDDNDDIEIHKANLVSEKKLMTWKILLIPHKNNIKQQKNK